MTAGALVDRLYEAAAFPECWPSVLEELGRTVDTPAVVLLTRRNDAWVGCAVSKPFEESMMAYLGTDIPSRSQTTSRLLAADHAGFVTEADVFSENEWAAEPFYAEWGRKWGWNHAAATAIQVPSGDLLVFHVQRPKGVQGFGRRDVDMLDSYRPHLARAGMLAARWRLERLRAAAEALALIGLPAAVLDRQGRVLAANTLIEAMTSHLQWLPGDRIRLVDRTAHDMLGQALAGLFDPAAPAVRSFPARGKSGAVVVHLVPTPGRARDIFAGGLGVLVMTPVAMPQAPDAALIRGLFDLSPSEARVARCIAQGHSVEQIAATSGVAQETVRTHVKRVMAKTGTNRQAEVAVLLSGLSKLPVADHGARGSDGGSHTGATHTPSGVRKANG